MRKCTQEEIYSELRETSIREFPWNEDSSIYFKDKMKNVLSMIEGRYSRILDIGCGEGIITNSLLKFSDRVFGCDLVVAPLQRASKKFGKKIVLFQFNLIKDKLNWSFDLVLCLDMLYYIMPENIDKAVDNLASLVSENGQLLYSTNIFEKYTDEAIIKKFVHIKEKNIQLNHQDETIKEYRLLLLKKRFPKKIMNIEKNELKKNNKPVVKIQEAAPLTVIYPLDENMRILSTLYSPKDNMLFVIINNLSTNKIIIDRIGLKYDAKDSLKFFPFYQELFPGLNRIEIKTLKDPYKYVLKTTKNTANGTTRPMFSGWRILE